MGDFLFPCLPLKISVWDIGRTKGMVVSKLLFSVNYIIARSTKRMED